MNEIYNQNSVQKNLVLNRKKSWRYCLAFLFGMLFMGVSSFAQTIQVGSGTATGSYLPIYYLFDKNYTQTIYTASELTNAGAATTGGTITKIRFKPTASVSTVNWRNWKIFMSNTSKASFTTTSDWIPIGNLTPVFDGSLQDNAVANTWIEITLNTPFVWNGSNVAVAITETTPSYGNSPSWASYTLAPAVGSKAIYKWQDGADIDINSPPLGTLINIVAQIQFDGTLQSGCTGVPNGGTAALSVATGNAGATFTASATGVTGASGLTYQWQKDVSGNWQNIAGATSKINVITAETGAIGTVTNYRLAVTCTASAETVYSTTTSYTISLSYCIPVGGGNSADEIKTFKLSNLNNTSAPSAGVAGYINYAGLVAPAQLQLGVPYTATVTGGTGSGNHGAAFWIDYNANGTFETSERMAFIGNTIQPGIATNFTEFTVPTGTPLGIYRLRVQYHYNKAGDLLDPCASSTLAETEDYSVEVLAAPTCVQPAALAASAITSTSATLSWTGTGSSFDIQWGIQGFVMGSVAATTVTGITSPYTLNNVLAPNTKYSFYVRKNCGATDGYSLWSGPYSFTTLCGIATAFTENFDSYTLTGATNPLPNCWTRFGNTANTYITTASTSPLTPPNRLYLSATATGTTLNAVAVMPPVSNLQAGTHRLKFKAFATAVSKTLEIGYYSIAEDASSFVVMEVFNLPSTANANATEFSYVPQFIPAGIQSLAFRNNGAAFTGTTTMYIDDVAWEPIPACFDISIVTFTNITGTSVDVEWNPGGTESAWEYVVAPSTVTSPVGLTPVSVLANPFLTIGTGLNPSTIYNFWVRSKCANNAVGNWSSVKTFTTACASVSSLPWNEGFESLTTTGTTIYPLCWFKENGDWSSSADVTYNTPKSGTKYIRNSWAAVNEHMWTPGFSLTAGVSYDFSFYMQGDGYAGWTVDVLQNTQQISTGATQIGQTEIPFGTGTTNTIQQYKLVKNTIIPTTSGVHYFAIKVNQPSTSPWYIAFDDFRMELTPTCVAPTVEPTSNITSTTATITWSAPAVPTNYQYFVTTDIALVPNATTVPTGTVAGTVNQVNLSILTPSSVYKVYVKALCTSTDISSWSAAGTFTTACGIVTTYSQNFDTSTTGTAAPMPLCWERAGNGSTFVTTGGIAPGTAPNRLYLFASGIAPATQAIAIMPPVSNLQANTHRLKFKAYCSTSAGRPLEIGYFTNQTDLSTFVLIESITLPGTLAAGAQTFTVNPANIPAGVQSLAFRNAGIPTASSAIYIDDVIWEAKPTVVPVCATNVLATPNATCGNFATVLTWTASADTDGYYLKIGTTTGASNVINNVNVGLVTSYNFLANANTTYFYSITPFNSAGPATGCLEQSFSTAVNGCYCTSVPTSNDGSGISNVQVGTQNFPTGDVMYFDHTATPVNLSQGITNNLKVTLATGITYGTNVWIDLNDNFTFETNELFFSGESSATNPFIQNASFLMPANAALGMHRMRIVSTDILQNPANPCYSGTYGVTLDFKVNITPAPTCLAPSGLSVTNTSITTTGATISWTASTTAAAEGYDYYFATVNTPPTAITTPSGTVGAGITTANLTGLASSSIQYVYVRAKCSTTDFSAWSQPITFFTLCDVNALPYIINFENVTIPNLPVCTINENVGTGNNWITATTPGSGFISNVLKYGWNGSNAANTWFFTNRFNLVAGTAYTVSYKYGATSATWIEKLRVSYGNAANSAAMTTELADHPTINTAGAIDNSVTFTPTVTGTYVIGFQAYSIANQFNLYIDDILISQNLGSTDFDSNKFTAYPNPVKNNLTIRYNENIKEVTVFNLLGQQLFVKVINATEGQIDMSHLASGTYLVKINSGDKVQTMKVIKE